MRRRLALFMLPLIASAGAAGTLSPPQDEGYLVNAVVALVNGDPVTKVEVDAHVADFLRANPDATAEDVREVWEKAREALIEHRLLIQEARRRNIQVDPEEVNDQVERYRKAGVDVEGRRDLIRERLMVQRMLRQLITPRSITPQEVTDYYQAHREEFVLPEQRHVYLIAIRSDPAKAGPEAAKAKAQELLEKLKRGGSFVALAKAHSQGAYADKGGDHGWIKKGSLIAPLEDALATLEPGEVAGPIPTPDGYALVKLAGVRPASRQSLAKARAAILERLQVEHRRRRRHELIERLRRTASIVRLNLRPSPAKRPTP